MKIFISNIYSTLKTKDKDVLKSLGKKYSAKAPGYQYTRAYQSGGWDGGKEFFSSRTGKFGTGLLSSILKDLDFIDRDYEIVDNRTPITFSSYKIPSITLRDYQQSLVEEALCEKGCIIKSPTGSGKTIVIASILKALSGKTGLLIFNKKQLLHQTSKFLTEHGIPHGVAFGDGVDIQPLTLCTIQSIEKVLDSHLKTSEFIMFDEIHEFAKGKLATSVLKSFPLASIRIGLTATPPSEKYSKLSLGSFLGREIEYATAEDLIAIGYLTPPTIHMIDLPDVPDTETIGLSYQELYDKFIVENEFRNQLIADTTEAIGKKPSKMLILTKNLRHAEILRNLIPGAYKLEGKDSLESREETLNKFIHDSSSSVMIGTIIFQTGVDIPELTHLINARGLKSEIATIQALGRTLRKHDSKKEVFIYDFIDKVPYLSAHSHSRLLAYKSLNFNIKTHGKTHKKRT